MTNPARQIVVVAAVGLVAAVSGFGAMALLTGAADDASPRAAVVPAAPPEEALLAPPPEPALAAVADPAPRQPPEAAQPRPPIEAEPAPAPADPPPRVEPEPDPEPAPGLPPDPPPAPDPDPVAPPAPVAPTGPPAAATAPPPAPPEGVLIPAGATPTGHDAAHRDLVAALGRAAPGSTTEADIRRMLALWREYLGPAASGVPEGRRATVSRALRANAWWFGGRGAPQRRVLLRDPDGVILTYRAGQGFAVNPVATTGRWRGLNADVPPDRLAEAMLPMGVARRAGERAFTVWEYYDVPGDPAAIRPGTSGMAQGRVALLMAHAQDRTGDPRFARAALGALAALTVDVDRGGARSMVTTEAAPEPGPWYVERAYPGTEPWTGGALNGFMVTLLNLRGAGAVLDRAAGGGAEGATAANLARDLADRGAVSLARHLDDHDTGSWSLYGLLTPGRAWRSYLADLNYHCYHVRLLDQLAEPYPDEGFADVAARWRGYVDAAGATCPVRAAG